MKILSFEVIGLFGRDQPIAANLNPDLNIITGPNGAGKTTILKLLWYMLSGNIHIAIREIQFLRATLQTTEYTCTVFMLNSTDCRVEVNHGGSLTVFEDQYDDDHVSAAETAADSYIEDIGSSLFLPTFRRIEGGFTIGTKRNSFPTTLLPGRASGQRNDVEEGLIGLSRRLTNQLHTFVASISTTDVVSLLLQRYADLSQQSQEAQRLTSQDAIDEIKSYKNYPSRSAELVIDDILAKIEFMDADRERIMQPFCDECHRAQIVSTSRNSDRRTYQHWRRSRGY